MNKAIKSFFKRKIVENVLLIFILLGVIITVFTPNLPFIQRSADLANQSMMIYLAFGMFFLIVDQTRLMIVTMISAAIFAFFLKESTNSRIKYATVNSSEKFKISLINLSSIDSDPSKVIRNIAKKNFDLLVFQEYTPNWKSLIEDNLNTSYPFKISIPRIDVYGLNVYSRYPILKQDTLYCEEIPILRLEVFKNNQRFIILTAYFPPPINNLSKKINQDELNLIAQSIKDLDEPVIVAGVFNIVPWSPEIQSFKDKGDLIDSRSGYIPSMDKNSGGIFGKPVTHIFYKPALECTNFNISRADNDEYGIEAFFQLQENK